LLFATYPRSARPAPFPPKLGDGRALLGRRADGTRHPLSVRRCLNELDVLALRSGRGREGGARGARLWRVGRSAAGGGDAAASDLQIEGGGARQGSAAGKAAGLHLGQVGQGRLVEVGAHRSTACDEKS
jgi:hypothetical protein